MMEWTALPGIQTMRFDVRLAGDKALQQVAFIYLLSMKFDGEAHTDGSTHKYNRRRFGRLEVKFKDYMTTLEAAAFCNTQLSEDGLVREHYVGALDKADPGFLFSRALLAKFKKDKNGHPKVVEGYRPY
jgi:hypothetical protein